ncbi:dynamin family protein [Filifactor villosus]|uniref:Dynamin family protein n=1 Tax=Filifactor villosus TaxID=29374 RepID=A0ABV9QHF5_9FIRM
MNMMEQINEFVDVMLEEKSKFEDMKNQINKRENEVSEVLDHLSESTKNIVSKLKGQISNRNDEMVADIFDKASQTISSNIKESNEKVKEGIKGMAFIQDFESRFTISVFGKVKAGKSYLGNFIMGNTLRTKGIPSSYDKVEDMKVHVYDRGKIYEQNKMTTMDEERECNGQEFYVNKSEATSTIQWIDLGAMCWFDTPGIGSVTEQNELLAKEYVKNSDLIIFASNSDAAGTRQEFSEIKQLHEMGKPMLLLLTQSDAYDYEEDDEGDEISILIPKSEKDRKDQEEYMLTSLREQGMEDVLQYADVLTVSALLATEAIEHNDQEMFEASNMGKLLSKLVEITKNDASEMKKKTPRDRVNAMINSVIESLEQMHSEIGEFCSKIDTYKDELIGKKQYMIEQIKAKANMKVLEIIAKAKAEVEKGEVGEIKEEELASSINMAISEAIQRVCMEQTLLQSQQVSQLDLHLTGIGDLKMRQEKIAYEHSYVKEVERDAEGFFENVGKIIFKKKYYTSKIVSETRYSTFDIGVNDNEIANNIILQLNDVFDSTVSDYIEGLTKGYYEPVEALHQKTSHEIKSALNRLEGMRM